VKTTRLVVSTVLVALVMGGFAMSPARAATKPAEDTWAGRVEKDRSPQGSAGAPRDHYDYVGRPCPESADVCTAIMATYRIAPLNPSAARAVRRLSGGQARLHGYFEPGSDAHHSGTLFVRRAERPAPVPKTVSLDDASDGSTVTLRPGDHLDVLLHSTYWTFNRPSDRAVLSADGKPVYGPGESCPPYPGSGCGTVSVRYTARRAGSAVVSADRSSCGEAVRCTPDALHWAVKVKVSR
jgi:hypothetical protein